MTEQRGPGPLVWIVTTLLAWLGLAGVSDNFVDWQDWFEAGVMQHWRSVKEWIIAVLLDWAPFRVRPWMLDYALLGGIVSRAYRISFDRVHGADYAAKARARFGSFNEMPRLRLSAVGVLLVLLGVLLIATAIVIGTLFWPLFFLVLLVPWPGTQGGLGSAASRQFLRELLVSFLWFIPVLFVTSTLLYDFG